MPRSAFSNLKRRGAAYWWRRTVSLVGLVFPDKLSISCEFSLFTKELDLARGRSAAMTAHSERLKMSLRKQVAEHGLNQDTAATIFTEEMRAYRDELVHLEALWKAHPVYSTVSTRSDDLAVFESLWAGIAADGLGVPRDWEFIERHFARFDDDMKARIHSLLRDHPDLPDTVRKAAMQRLQDQGLIANAFNIPFASDLVLQARAAAARAVREGNHLIDPAALAIAALHQVKLASAQPEPAVPSPAAVTAAPPTSPPQPVQAKPVRTTSKKRSSGQLNDEQARFAAMTPTEFAEVFIEDVYGDLGHREGTKRPNKAVGDPTMRDIRWAALLLEKAMPAGAALSSATKEHCTELDTWFDRLPVTIGKSSWDKKPETTFEMIEQRAIERVENGEMSADQFGLAAPTTNKHWHNIIRLHEHLRSVVPGIEELKIRKFITPEVRNSRDARDGLTVEQGTAIFSLPPWTGCLSFAERLKEGGKVIHDGLYFILMLVWYTGARREEICKLRLEDVFLEGPVPYIFIRGELKTLSSQRLMPIHSELLRLGFAMFVEAMREAGETLLFPELYPAEATKRAVGDVFYKLWWIYIRPLVPSLKRGQAMHSVRHTVSNALKQAGFSLEARNDFLGHSQKPLGDGASTYPEPLSLELKKEMAEKIPVVTGHLPDCTTITLLPANRRCARPSRKSGS